MVLKKLKYFNKQLNAATIRKQQCFESGKIVVSVAVGFL